MPYVQFFVRGDPKGQPRPKAFSRGGHARVYDPATAEWWKSQIAVASEQHRPEAPVSSAITVSLTFYLRRPKAHFGTGRNAGKLKPSAPAVHEKKPDIDNLAKAVLDALTELQFWDDDKLVNDLRVRRQWAQTESGCNVGVTW